MGKQVKVRFNLQGDPVSGESLWAEHIEGELYRLLNVPFYAKGYAEGDIVRCIKRDSWYEVTTVEQHSGNGTVRIYFATTSASLKAQHVLNELVSVGCTYEQATPNFVAVSVPVNIEVTFSQLSSFLNSMSDDVVIGWEVGKKPTVKPI